MQVWRSTHRRTLAVALLASSSLVAVTPAFAQDNEEDNVIIVTSQKREQNLQDVPVAITALGTEKLEELHVNELQDVVKFLPSVTIQTSGPGFSQVYFRAVSSGENANHSGQLPPVGTYLDEMPVTTIQGALDIHAYDLARIEALAGPQGTLFGASSMAGTIRLITNQPDTSGNYGAADLELNSVNHGGVGGTAEGFFNFALSDMAAARLVAWYRKDAGYIDNIQGCRTFASSGIEQCNDAFVDKNYNDADTYGARLALGIDLDDNWTIRPTVMGQVQKTNGIFAEERSNAVTDHYQVVQYNPEWSKDKWIQAALTIEGKIGDWDLVATGGHLRRHDEVVSDYSDYSYFYDAISGYGNYFYDNNGDLVNPNQYVQGADTYRRFFGEFRVSSPQDNPLRLIAGVFAQRQSHLIEQNYIIDDIADVITVPGTESNIWLTKERRVDRDYAAFGELSYDITDKLTLTGGIRVYNYKNTLAGFFGYAAGYSGDKVDPLGAPGVIVKDGTGVAGCGILDGPQRPAIVPGSPCTNLDKVTSDTDFIHKLNLTYKATDDVMFYATWSRGFRPGGINRNGALPPYSPDKLSNYELGWKTQFGPVTFNGAVYQLDWDNIQLSFLGPNGLTEIRNAGIARIRGIEADFTYRKGGLTINLGGSYNDAKIRRDFCKLVIAADPYDCTLDAPDSLVDHDLLPEENSVLAPAGTQIPVTPKFKGSAVARYEFPLGSSNGHVQFAASHVGKRRNDLRTETNAILGNLPAYTTLDLSLGFDTGKYRVEIFANNLFNSHGVINSSTQCNESICGDEFGDTAAGGTFYDTVIRPRLIGVKIGADF